MHALDLARYLVRYLPPASAVLAISFSGKVGRTTEAALQAAAFGHPVIALTNEPDGQLGRRPTTGSCRSTCPRSASPRAPRPTSRCCARSRPGAAELAELAADGAIRGACEQLPGQAATTLDWCDAPASGAAARMASARFVTFLGAGPNEATARFGAAKLFEGPQRLAVATNLEEWAHEEYFVTRPGDPVVLVAPAGAAHDRAGRSSPSSGSSGRCDGHLRHRAAGSPAGHLPLAAGVPEELSPVLAALPLALLGFHLARQTGKRSYNFPSPRPGKSTTTPSTGRPSGSPA